LSYRAEHGVGFQPRSSGSRLKWVLVMNGSFKYRGSSTMVVTTIQAAPKLSGRRVKYSVTDASSL
jgi:hypothetical protein